MILLITSDERELIIVPGSKDRHVYRIDRHTDMFGDRQTDRQTDIS